MRYLWILIICSTGFTQCLGDMNEDGIKDILDIVNLVNDILDGDDQCEDIDPYDCLILEEAMITEAVAFQNNMAGGDFDAAVCTSYTESLQAFLDGDCTLCDDTDEPCLDDGTNLDTCCEELTQDDVDAITALCPGDGECNCPAPDFESGTDQCVFMTNESCIEDCGFDPDDIDIYEGWIPVCTDCLANDDCDDAVEAYEECFGCLDNCDDEDAPPNCIDMCTLLYCP